MVRRTFLTADLVSDTQTTSNIKLKPNNNHNNCDNRKERKELSQVGTVVVIVQGRNHFRWLCTSWQWTKVNNGAIKYNGTTGSGLLLFYDLKLKGPECTRNVKSLHESHSKFGWEVTKKETFAVNCCNQPQGQRGSRSEYDEKVQGSGTGTGHGQSGSKAAVNVNWAICCRWGLSSSLWPPQPKAQGPSPVSVP